MTQEEYVERNNQLEVEFTNLNIRRIHLKVEYVLANRVFTEGQVVRIKRGTSNSFVATVLPEVDILETGVLYYHAIPNGGALSRKIGFYSPEAQIQ